MARFSDRATRPARGPLDILRWNVGDRLIGRITGRALPRDRSGYRPPGGGADATLLARPEPALTWIGHATFVLRLAGKLVATDPIFSTRIAGTVRRTVAPGVALEDVPALDIVTVTHNHMDHMDLPTLRRIG